MVVIKPTCAVLAFMLMLPQPCACHISSLANQYVTSQEPGASSKVATLREFAIDLKDKSNCRIIPSFGSPIPNWATWIRISARCQFMCRLCLKKGKK